MNLNIMLSVALYFRYHADMCWKTRHAHTVEFKPQDITTTCSLIKILSSIKKSNTRQFSVTLSFLSVNEYETVF